MANEQIYEMISAFAAGCMDRENFIQFREYIEAGGELPKKELGELQNTMALVPIILELEKPDIELKNRVAKRLLSLQDEIKEKIKEKKKKLAEQKARGEISETEADVEFPDFQPTFTTQEINTLRTIEKRKTADKKVTGDKETGVEQRAATEDKRSVQQMEPERKTAETKVVYKTGRMSLYGWIAAAVFIVISIALYFWLSSSVSSLQNELDTKTEQLEKMQHQLAISKQTESEYKELLAFLKYKDNYIVEFSGGSQYPSALGRMIVSFRQGEAILVLDNPPPLAEDEAYQVWMVTKGKSISLGVLSKENMRRYYFIYNVPKLALKEIELFRITNEPVEGSVIPLGNTLLFGNVPEY